MTRTKKSPGLARYYEALQDIFAKQSKILTAVLPHFGERGRNDEERLRLFLRQILPERFSIETGFVISSDRDAEPSPQNDIVIYDRFWNPALFPELAAEVYPIETVYATIEVKGLLEKAAKGRNPRKSDLDRALENIATIRKMATTKQYVRYEGVRKDDNRPNELVVAERKFSIALPPRAYVFAYAKKGWRGIEDFQRHLQEKLQEHSDAHLHGIVVLEKNWFACQEAYSRTGRVVRTFNDNSLLHFINTLLIGIQSIVMAAATLQYYLQADIYPSPETGGPGDSESSSVPRPSTRSQDRT